MAETSLEKLERQYEQAKARLQAARARKTVRDRKLQARRKIILGAALIERAARDPQTATLLASLIKGLKRQQDRKAFEDWQPPALPQTPVAADQDEDQATSLQKDQP